MTTTGAAGDPPAEPVVIYIAGMGRSGSTLLDRLLGLVPGVVGVGQLGEIFSPGHAAGGLCGCGLPPRRCGFWQEVVHTAFCGWDSPDFRQAVRLRRIVARERRLPALMLRRALVTSTPAERDFAELYSRAYAAIASAAAADVVVDSTKELPIALLVAGRLGARLRLVHLVRDPRAVANSWTRRVSRPRADAAGAALDRYPPARTALRWLVLNALLDVWPRGPGRPALVKYETLCDDAPAQLRRLVAPLGLDCAAVVRSDGYVDLPVAHTVAGNPTRFATGPTLIERDDAWQRELPRRSRVLVSVLTAPGLVRYGYVGRRGPLHHVAAG